MLKNIFSVSSINEKLSLLKERFPISVLLIICLAITRLIDNYDYDKVPFNLYIFFSIGIPISIATVLFCEDFLSNLKTHIISFIAVLLCGVYSIFAQDDFDDLMIDKGIEFFVLCAAAVSAIFFISFLKKSQDDAFWNFTSQTLFQLAISYVFSAVLCGGLSLAFVAVSELFNVEFSKAYINLITICFSLFFPVYFLANIPNKTEKHNPQIFYTKLYKIFSLNILTPILAVYTVILYVYLLKIIFTWELPKGFVSWLVSVLAVGGLAVITFIYPLNKKHENKVATFISRWFCLLILPLLMLMSVAISRRISDYGITINRCYILLLNMWFYGIYIYLFFTRSRSIKWILISVVSVAVLTSVNVWGVSAFTKNYLTKEIKTVFNAPISTEKAKAIFSEKSQKEQERIESTLKYLNSNFGKESVQIFFTDSVTKDYWNFIKAKKESEYFHYNSGKILNDIKDYNYFAEINYNPRLVLSDNETSDIKRVKEAVEFKDTFKDTIDILVSNRKFSFAAREIILAHLAADKKETKEENYIITGEDYNLILTNFNGSYYPEKDSIQLNNLKGYLFYR